MLAVRTHYSNLATCLNSAIRDSLAVRRVTLLDIIKNPPTMTFRSISVLSLSISLCVNGQSTGKPHDNIVIMKEGIQSIDSYKRIRSDHRFLRRQLQTNSLAPTSCKAINPLHVYACEEYDIYSNSPCKESNATCADHVGDYACKCTGSSETSCSYCQIQTANSILCQVTGTSATFFDSTFAVMTCSCEYLGNGQLMQICYPPTSRPTSMPMELVSIDVRSPSMHAPVPTTLVVPVDQPTALPSQGSVVAPTKTKLGPSWADLP